MKHTYVLRGQTYSIDIAPAGGGFVASYAGKSVPVEMLRADGQCMDLLINGRITQAWVTRDGSKTWVTVNGQTQVLSAATETRKNSRLGSEVGSLTAPMPGLVRSVNVADGDIVKKGQTLAVIEAMKMENKVAAPFDGIVKKTMIHPGQSVERDQLLVELSARTDPSETA
jgi:acetyl-CoA/propionyl-CoA carboxylase biotin carboxyl carrier protein